MIYVQLDKVLDEVKTWISLENELNRKHLILEGIESLAKLSINPAVFLEIDIDGRVSVCCSNCHRNVKNDFNFCPYCGAQFGKNSPT